ncbi:Zinc finger, C2H2 type family protein [Trichomonas vaginalis G3]|uniref:Zinc finger, C2H2 type family protein n=1 Tax=Trichomonas vaginalis (strain ATCC PRA-98 / G3) TaxID=412133 RepID=A2F215_TRIV3|nr:hypothetical protein TVAGG3_0477230 [Trichomonas vaginalis G3]EAY01070.1 Zinc finger, C2H2 type family protein [Trichomonas vaginalis G3]KAI5515493.1 hypothetical protein TVAGG3_0477230 [Trichomonas vaginalis G3]|eukprot:XP_001330091.1 Zinc finger, C2H2 type family protein [Trichomonas vaginalis G3]
MKKNSADHGQKNEGRFPWVFKTEGSIHYFKKCEKKVIYFSVKEVDVKKIAEDVFNSTVLGVGIDLSPNGSVRVISICSKTYVFVISINNGYIISALGSFLSSLNSKLLVGYNIDRNLSALKTAHGITLNVKDLLLDPEYSDGIKAMIDDSEIKEVFKRGELDIQNVAKFETLFSLSNQVMTAITFPAVLSYYYITSNEGNRQEAIPLPHKDLLSNREIIYKVPFALLPPEKPKIIHKITPINNTSSDSMQTNKTSISSQPALDSTSLKISSPDPNYKPPAPKTFDIDLQKTMEERPTIALQRQSPVSTPLVITRRSSIPKLHTETPPPPDVKPVTEEGKRHRKESLPSNSAKPIIVKYKRRISTNNDKNCPICNKQHTTSVAVGIHIVSDHGIEFQVVNNFKRVGCPNYVCALCNQYIPSIEMFITHIVDSHTQELYEFFKSIEIPEKKEEVLEFISNLAASAVGTISEEVFNDLKKMELNLVKKGQMNKELKCLACNETFETHTELLMHCWTSHN